MSVLKNILTLHAQRYPAMEARDYVKLLYQSEFGPGHLVEAEDALEALRTEFDQAVEEGYAPEYAVEAIGGGLCRTHLDPRLFTQADLPLLARCFAQSARPRGTMTGLWEKLGALAAMAWTGELPLDSRELELFLTLYESEGCPPLRHSEGYRDLYHPHYRVLDRDLALYAPALRAIDALLRNTAARPPLPKRRRGFLTSAAYSTWTTSSCLPSSGPPNGSLPPAATWTTSGRPPSSSSPSAGGRPLPTAASTATP